MSRRPENPRRQLRVDLPALPHRLTAEGIVKIVRNSWSRCDKADPPKMFAVMVQSQDMAADSQVTTAQVGSILGTARAVESMLALLDHIAEEQRDPRLIGARFLVRSYLEDARRTQ